MRRVLLNHVKPYSSKHHITKDTVAQSTHASQQTRPFSGSTTNQKRLLHRGEFVGRKIAQQSYQSTIDQTTATPARERRVSYEEKVTLYEQYGIVIYNYMSHNWWCNVCNMYISDSSMSEIGIYAHVNYLHPSELVIYALVGGKDSGKDNC